MQVWNRKELVDIPEVGAGAIRFVYGTAFGRILAKGILCRKWVSNLYAAWEKSRFSRKKVAKFMAQYHISAEDCTLRDFPNFNAFFTRQRVKIDNHCTETELPAIADSKLLALPMTKGQTYPVKGVSYTAEELLENASLAKNFDLCLIFRLSPEDYHRYAFPDAGTAEETVEIAGVLHTVNPIASDLKVYRRNTRHYTLLHTEHFGDMVEMEVGALLVGKIRNHGLRRFAKLQEKGYFEYGGSTVILLCKGIQMDKDILEHSARGIETVVRMGERIGVKA